MVKEIILCDTTYTPSYDEYKEWCEMVEVEPQSEGSDAYWRFVYDTQSDEWEDFLMNIKHCELNDSKWVVSGVLHLWHGVQDILPLMFDSLLEAVCACYGSSINDIKVVKRDDDIVVKCSHHNGQNRFYLNALTDLGIKRYERNKGKISTINKENIQRLPEHLF